MCREEFSKQTANSMEQSPYTTANSYSTNLVIPYVLWTLSPPTYFLASIYVVCPKETVKS